MTSRTKSRLPSTPTNFRAHMAVSVLFVSENSVAARVAAAVTRSCAAAVSSDHLPQLQLSCAASGELTSSMPELPGHHGLELGDAESMESLSADQFDLLVVCGDTGVFPDAGWRYWHTIVVRLALHSTPLHSTPLHCTGSALHRLCCPTGTSLSCICCGALCARCVVWLLEPYCFAFA